MKENDEFVLEDQELLEEEKIQARKYINETRDTRFIHTFTVSFEGACMYSFEELIEKAIKDYGTLTNFFKNVKFFWNEFFGRVEVDGPYGDGWLGFFWDSDGAIFSYIEDTDYKVIRAWVSDYDLKDFTIQMSIPRKYNLKIKEEK